MNRANALRALVLLTVVTLGCGPSDGVYVDHHPNGKVKVEGAYRDGMKTGKWIYYWSDGATQTEGFYTKDEPSGTWTYYGKGGRMMGKGTYRDGKMWDGTFVRYVIGTTKIMRLSEGKEKVK